MLEAQIEIESNAFYVSSKLYQLMSEKRQHMGGYKRVGFDLSSNKW